MSGALDSPMRRAYHSLRASAVFFSFCFYAYNMLLPRRDLHSPRLSISLQGLPVNASTSNMIRIDPVLARSRPELGLGHNAFHSGGRSRSGRKKANETNPVSGRRSTYSVWVYSTAVGPTRRCDGQSRIDPPSCCTFAAIIQYRVFFVETISFIGPELDLLYITTYIARPRSYSSWTPTLLQ